MDDSGNGQSGAVSQALPTASSGYLDYLKSIPSSAGYLWNALFNQRIGMQPDQFMQENYPFFPVGGRQQAAQSLVQNIPDSQSVIFNQSIDPRTRAMALMLYGQK